MYTNHVINGMDNLRNGTLSRVTTQDPKKWDSLK